VTLEGRRSLRICDLEALSAFANQQTNESDGYAPAMAA
jgi:hypothetical protein